MKKLYTKPIVVIESFALSQSVAHNCSDGLDFTQATTKYKSTCGWNLGDMDLDGKADILFTASVNDCNMTDFTEADFGYCYNNPEGALNIFNS